MSPRYASSPSNVRSGARSTGALAVSALLSLGCSEGVHRLGGPGQAAAPLDPADRVIGRCRTHADLEMIDDMEDRVDTILFVENRTGFWFAFNDSLGTQHPRPGADQFLMAQLDPPRGESWYAVQTYGSGFGEWGAGIGFDVHSRNAYDASSYAGVAFWARLTPGTTDTNPALRMEITDRNSVPQGFVCNDVDVQCYANFGADFVITDTWAFFEFPWSVLQQPGWQDRSYPSIERSAVYGIRFQVETEQPFDFQLDDVAFLCPAR